MKYAALALLVALSACASGKWRPQAVRPAEVPLQRGWSYAETEREFLNQEMGVPPVSYSAPLLAGEKVVFGSERFGLSVLSKRTGQLLWRRRFAEPVAAQPLVIEDQVFVGSGAGDLHLLELEKGHERWVTELGAPIHGAMLYAFGHLIVATVDEAVHAVDPATGRLLWTYRRPAFSGTSIRGGGNPAAIGGQIWMGFSDGALVSLDPANGAVSSERSFHDSPKFTDLDARVLGWKDGLLVTTYDGKLRSLRRDGSLNWAFDAGGARAPLLSEGDTIYLPSSDGVVYAVDAESGKERWRYTLKRGVPTGVALLKRGAERILLVTGSAEKVLALDALSGRLREEFSLGRGSGSYAPIAVEENNRSFYVLSSFSRVYQFLVN